MPVYIEDEYRHGPCRGTCMRYHSAITSLWPASNPGWSNRIVRTHPGACGGEFREMVTGFPVAVQFSWRRFRTFAEVRKRSTGFLHRTDERERRDAANCAECHSKLGYPQEVQDRRRWNQKDPEPLDRNWASNKLPEILPRQRDRISNREQNDTNTIPIS
jgi:hypothetical protein